MQPSAARATLLAVALSYGSQDVALRLVLTLTAAPSPPAVALVKALIQAAAFAPPYFFSRRDGAAPPWSVSLGLAAALVASNEFLLEGIKRTSAAKAASNAANDAEVGAALGDAFTALGNTVASVGVLAGRAASGAAGGDLKLPDVKLPGGLPKLPDLPGLPGQKKGPPSGFDE